MNFLFKNPISIKLTVMALALAMVLGMPLTALADQNPAGKTNAVAAQEQLVEGPTVIKDSASPTGYTVRFVYKNESATRVTFAGDMLLRNWADPSDTKVYTPFEYKHGLMRGGGAYEVEMEKREGGYWVTEVPLAAGANQYWFYVDGNRNFWAPDPANPPKFAPDGLTGNARRAFNAVYVPNDPDKQDALMGAREIENPRTDGKKRHVGLCSHPDADQRQDKVSWRVSAVRLRREPGKALQNDLHAAWQRPGRVRLDDDRQRAEHHG
ncbi:early set domain-containing protein [Cohnella rhizosphaerae]|uniref:Uncharacterized protein n=1 Tax=Cohnella rhizosphaerae TaxID=1457232 RepID=A0A9X4QV04_9BACL|nr:hypothetical protein [Cohnella rhizosphaerae]MDG0812801.1 hypothetical protein [Cohnella rhizosphaerae]